jgi:hypothetical protein
MTSRFELSAQPALVAPKALRRSHEELRDGFARAAMAGGAIARAATHVSRLCLSHFWHEEQSVFPLLALLPLLEHGHARPEMKDALPLIADFRAKRHVLADHHQTILAAIDELRDAASRANARDTLDFAYALQLHEKIEDEVVYPSVVLIGNYLEQTLAN